ncbi:DUF305 domain-containing protein [Daejeonella sp. JGW-45]|uniref:DUF305 domain-containing protein n=1 Tax=Daejeonella sp. JGW-45 TaxID=3034148 RepID=UPI0023EB0F4B|nr:DUF305 domain-containing protein [Daejeonella sp. JGW-45]
MNNNNNNNYRTFFIMILASFFIMYAVMYLNVDSINHIYLNTTRLYMTLMMVALMSLLMLALMRMMYQNKKSNLIIVFSSITIFFLALTGVRTQTPIGDVQYMKGMIPHHSIAIMTSKNANLKDPEVKQLAQEIITAQEKEIAQMKRIIARMK